MGSIPGEEPVHWLTKPQTSCALVNGIAAPIVQRSEELSLLHAQGQDLVVACAKLSEQEEKNLEEAVRPSFHYVLGAKRLADVEV